MRCYLCYAYYELHYLVLPQPLVYYCNSPVPWSKVAKHVFVFVFAFIIVMATLLLWQQQQPLLISRRHGLLLKGCGDTLIHTRLGVLAAAYHALDCEPCQAVATRGRPRTVQIPWIPHEGASPRHFQTRMPPSHAASRGRKMSPALGLIAALGGPTLKLI